MIVELIDLVVFWVLLYLEMLLLCVWYLVIVVIISWYVWQIIVVFLQWISDDLQGQLLFKLYDFGVCGVLSLELVVLGGVVYLVNFFGIDIVLVLCLVCVYYYVLMVGYLIFVVEYSIIISWGCECEVDVYCYMLCQFGMLGVIVVVVLDSYDIYCVISEYWGIILCDEVIVLGVILVICFDLGDLVEVVVGSLCWLDEVFGYVINGKGYCVFNYVWVIQGDGINLDMICVILQCIIGDGYLVDNVVFGMGGVLLQWLDCDIQKFVLKCLVVWVGGEWIDVYKDLVIDVGKISKCGCMYLLWCLDDGSLYMVVLLVNGDDILLDGFEDVMVIVWENGCLLYDQWLDDIWVWVVVGC